MAAAAWIGLVSTAPGLDPKKAISQYSHAVWQTEHGLPQNTVRAIVQTPDGYLWFGTRAGLVRFDGVRFEVFDRDHTPALESHHVRALAVDREGALWIGTEGALVGYRDGVFRRYGPPAGPVRALETTPSGELWIGIGDGLAKLAGEIPAPVLERPLGHEILALARDPRGGLWIGTEGGGLHHRAADGTLERIGPDQGLAAEVVWALHAAADGTLWIGTDQGLARLRDGALTVYRPQDGRAAGGIRALCLDRDDTLWLGTAEGELRRFRDGSFGASDAEALATHAPIVALFEDREGSLWTGTVGGGLRRLADGTFTTLGIAEGLPSQQINAVAGAGDGDLWIGTRDRGLARLVGDRVESFAREGGARIHDDVRALLPSRDGGLWLGTHGGGLARLVDRRFTVYDRGDGLAGDRVRGLAEEADGTLWVGTDRGLTRLVDGRFTTFGTADGLAGDDVRALRLDHRGELWVGAVGGLSRRRGDHFESFTRTDGLGGDTVRAIYEDHRGALWLALGGDGLSRYHDGRFSHFSRRDGLYDDDVVSLVEDDDGNLWMGSGRGIFRLGRTDLEAFETGRLGRLRQLAFGRLDGLARAESGSGDPAAWKTPDGRLWFATVGGVATVDPGRVAARPAPAVLLEAFEVDGEPRPLSGEARLPAASRTVVLRFTAPALRAASKIRFRYRLRGFDPEWVNDEGQRLARYVDLEPGRYRFEVMASDEAGRWTGDPTSLTFDLEPRWYRRASLQALAAVLGLAGVFALYRLRASRRGRRERELERRVEDALARSQVFHGMLRICAECKKVRDEDRWRTLESFLESRSEVSVSHGLCPQCAVHMMRDSDDVDTEALRVALRGKTGVG